MMSGSPPKPRVRRDRDRFDELGLEQRAPAVQMPPRHAPRHHTSAGSASSSPDTRSGSGSGSGSGSRAGACSAASNSPSQASPARSFSDRPTTATTYPNYYDYSEADGPLPLPQYQQQPFHQGAKRATANMNMAMQVPMQPQQPQAPQQRLVDHPGAAGQHPSSSSSRPQSASGPSPQLATAQLAQTARGGPQLINSGNANGNHRAPSGARDRPPSYSGSQNGVSGPRSPADDIFPPNKVDLDAARYRRDQQQSRRDRDRDRDRDRPNPPAKDPRDRRPLQNAGAARGPSIDLNNNPIANNRNNNSSNNNNMAPQHHRPISPESLLTPTGNGGGLAAAIQRLPTPSVPNSVLQPLDAKVVEYGTLMADAQGEMARLDEEMRALQERQRGAEQRFLEAKAKHDDYRRQYADVERALRGEFGGGGALGGRGGRGSDREVAFLDGDDGDGQGRRDRNVPPVPSMPSLQQYGVGSGGPGSRSGSGNLLNNGAHNGGPGGPGMRSQRTVSIQSDQESLNGYGRQGSKRGRWSRVFGIGA